MSTIDASTRIGGIVYWSFIRIEVLMQDATAKQLALRAVEQLPEDATLEDAMERLFFLEKIERGRADVREGRVVSHEEVVRRFRQ